jgi:MYXO-CTERM domain-containing protein
MPESMHPNGRGADQPRMRSNPSGRHLRWRTFAAVALALAGCDEHVGCAPVLTGEAGQLELVDQTLVVDAADRLHGVRALVEGSRFCPELGCAEDVPGCVVDEDDDERVPPDDVRACYADAIDGPVTVDGPCVIADAPGELDWRFTAQPCPADASGYQPGDDRLRLPIVAAAQLQPWLQSPGDGFAVRELVDEDGGPFPDDAQLAPGRTAYVLADTPVHLAIVLAHPDHGEPVAWNPSDWTASPGGDVTALELDAWGVLRVVLPSGAAIEPSLDRDALALPIGRIEAVDPADIVSLEIVVGYARDDEAPDGHRMPIGARAVARTADDRVVYGVPAEWEVTRGALPLWRDAALQWDPDFTALMDRDGRGCHEPADHPTTYRAEVVARWGTLEHTRPIEWTEAAADDGVLGTLKEWFGNDDHDDADSCEGPGFGDEGCGCRQGEPGAAPLLALGLVLLGLRARRRQSGAPS